jgi:hypothetical protein
MPNNGSRNRSSGLRNTRYSLLDDFAARQRQTAAGVAWRWRTELAILGGLGGALADAARIHRFAITAACLAAILTILAALPPTRRFLTRRAWCVLTRHRIHKVCWETRLHTRSGRLPLVLWTRPTQVGERLWLVCRAGISAEDFTEHQSELAAACFAREARITRNLRWSHLITVDIIRRDTLAATRHIPSPLPARTRARPHKATTS